MAFAVHSLTSDRWPDFEDLFDTTGPAGRCWCLYWRIGPDYRRRPAAENRAAMRERVAGGPPPGLLAYDGARCVGWCQLTPRDELPWLGQNRRLRPVDALPVWSISCFYIRKGYRRRGVTAALIAAAIETARLAGIPALEGYPLDAERTPGASHTGFVTTFRRAGFEEIARHVPERPIMRLDLGTADPLARAVPSDPTELPSGDIAP